MPFIYNNFKFVQFVKDGPIYRLYAIASRYGIDNYRNVVVKKDGLEFEYGSVKLNYPDDFNDEDLASEEDTAEIIKKNNEKMQQSDKATQEQEAKKVFLEVLNLAEKRRKEKHDMKKEEPKIVEKKEARNFGKSFINGVEIDHNLYIARLPESERNKVLEYDGFSVFTIQNPPCVIVNGVVIYHIDH